MANGSSPKAILWPFMLLLAIVAIAPGISIVGGRYADSGIQMIAGAPLPSSTLDYRPARHRYLGAASARHLGAEIFERWFGRVVLAAHETRGRHLRGVTERNAFVNADST
jgi:hypothetical protein